MAITRILGIMGMGTISGDVVEAVAGNISSRTRSDICLEKSNNSRRFKTYGWALHVQASMGCLSQFVE